MIKEQSNFMPIALSLFLSSLPCSHLYLSEHALPFLITLDLSLGISLSLLSLSLLLMIPLNISKKAQQTHTLQSYLINIAAEMIWPPKKRRHPRELENDSAAAAPQQQKQQQAGPGITNSSSNINNDSEVLPETKRVCRYCNREFNSGRALGGHIRVHYRNQPQQREEELEKAALTPRRKRTGPQSCSKKAVGEERFGNEEFVTNLCQALSGCGWKVHKKRGTHKNDGL